MIVQSGPAMKTRNRVSEAETRRHLGGKQWAEVKRGDGQSLIKTSLRL